MSSRKLPTLTEPEAAAAVFAAVQAVAEHSFFASAERCDDGALAELIAAQPSWLVATVRFEDGPFVGSITCTLPDRLAHALFGAFTGRDPVEPAAPRDQVRDLVGEFSNMVCGSWLTAVASGQAFTLSHPIVEPAPGPPAAGELRLLVAVNDLPMAVDVHLLPSAAHGDRTGAGA